MKKICMISACVTLLIVLCAGIVVTANGAKANSVETAQPNPPDISQALSDYALQNQTAPLLDETVETVSQIMAESGLDYKYSIKDYTPAAYEVELQTPNGAIFIEGSYTENSVYYATEYESYYYGGIGEYYGKRGDRWYNLITGNSSSYAPNTVCGFNFENAQKVDTTTIAEKSFFSNQVNGFKVIADQEYFRNLRYFPDHVNINKLYPGKVAPGVDVGTCGVVAVCALLGYYQWKTDWNIIPQSEFKYNNGTTDAFAEYLFKNWVWNGKSLIAEGTIMGTYTLSGYNPGFPMAAVEYKALIQKYTKSNGQSYKHTASGWYPSANVEKNIDNDTPCIGATTSYTKNVTYNKKKDDPTQGGSHSMIMYGYANQKYLCHLLWDPGYTSSSQRIVSDLVLHSYYTISK